MTYRWKEHVGPGDDWHLGYRTPEEMAPWLANDQLQKLAALLEREVRATIEEEVANEIAEAFAFAEASDFPEPEELYDRLFCR